MNDTSEKYYTDPDDYLKRARLRLEADSIPDLFYTALELRCFVEARQNQYLQAQEAYRRSLPKRWEIGKQGKELDAVFSLGKVQTIRQVFPSGFEFVARYVPVSKSLRNGAERLGRLLHSQSKAIDEHSAKPIREELQNLLEQADFCWSGNLANPMLFNPHTRQPIGAMQLRISADENETLKNMEVGIQFVAHVSYDEI